MWELSGLTTGVGGGGGGLWYMRNLESRNAFWRKFGTSSEIQLKIGYQIRKLWHNKHRLRMVVVISCGPPTMKFGSEGGC